MCYLAQVRPETNQILECIVFGIQYRIPFTLPFGEDALHVVSENTTGNAHYSKA